MNAIIFSAIVGIIMMFSSVFLKNNKTHSWIALACSILLLLFTIFEVSGVVELPINTKGELIFSNWSYYLEIVFFILTITYIILHHKGVEEIKQYTAEGYALIFFSLTGACILTAFNDLLFLFLGIEILSIPLYVLAGMDKKNPNSNEASVKYFLMGAFSTGILLMGIALLYGAMGSFYFQTDLPMGINHHFLSEIGIIIIFIALLFKIGAVPFHFWIADVYDGTPTSYTAFMATIVKSAAFIALIELFQVMHTHIGVSYKLILFFVIIATLFIGNITALFQQSVKRMLAYSGIAQVGFMLFALYGFNETSTKGILLYIITYSLANIGLFAVLSNLKDITYQGFAGLARSNPTIAFSCVVFLLSLTGIPLTGGFFAKYMMLASAVQYGGAYSMWLVMIGMLFATISAVYYFRLIQAIYFKDGTVAWKENICCKQTYFILLIAIVIIALGVFPYLGWEGLYL